MGRTTTKIFYKVMPALMAYVMVLLSSSSSLAQTCKPDCQNDDWGNLKTEILDLDYEGEEISCEVEVDFRTRRACQAFDDVFIQEIRFNESADCPFDMDNQSLAFNIIINELVKKNPWVSLNQMSRIMWVKKIVSPVGVWSTAHAGLT